MIPYSMTKRLITMAVIDAEENDDNKALIYVNGHEKREWLANILGVQLCFRRFPIDGFSGKW